MERTPIYKEWHCPKFGSSTHKTTIPKGKNPNAADGQNKSRFCMGGV